MKTLPQMLSDLNGLSDLLKEQAGQIEEIVQFFSGVSGMGGVSGVTTGAAAAPAVQPPRRAVPPPVAASAAPPPPLIKKQRGSGKSRALTDAEKAAIRRDWEELPPHLQTRTNRLALAAKHKVTAQHVFALTRSNPPLLAYHKAIAARTNGQAETLRH